MSYYGWFAREPHTKPKSVHAGVTPPATERRADRTNRTLREKKASQINRLIWRSENDYIARMTAMSESIRSRIQVFDPTQEYAVLERRLPHWSQPGTICFITFRTWDSIPEPVLKNWLAARDAWLIRHGISADAPDWRTQLETLAPKLIAQFQQLIADRWNDHLDSCHGACVLRRPENSQEVAKSLRHFDGDRYELTDFVVMPNHVHLLAAFPNEASMLVQCESWKHFTATQINRRIGRKDRFWQQDGFDHLVRSVEQFDHFRRYIADNPCRANLTAGEYEHCSKPL
jgi:type I restriction enzyme R subunit